jgi:hypothetical protein
MMVGRMNAMSTEIDRVAVHGNDFAAAWQELFTTGRRVHGITLNALADRWGYRDYRIFHSAKGAFTHEGVIRPSVARLLFCAKDAGYSAAELRSWARMFFHHRWSKKGDAAGLALMELELEGGEMDWVSYWNRVVDLALLDA